MMFHRSSTRSLHLVLSLIVVAACGHGGNAAPEGARDRAGTPRQKCATAGANDERVYCQAKLDHASVLEARAEVGGWKGDATVRLCIEPDGRVTQALVLKISDPSMTSSVQSAVLRWRFLPATLNGAPVRECRAMIFGSEPQR